MLIFFLVSTFALITYCGSGIVYSIFFGQIPSEVTSDEVIALVIIGYWILNAYLLWHEVSHYVKVSISLGAGS